MGNEYRNHMAGRTRRVHWLLTLTVLQHALSASTCVITVVKKEAEDLLPYLLRG
jgi:hypothetical protein